MSRVWRGKFSTDNSRVSHDCIHVSYFNPNFFSNTYIFSGILLMIKDDREMAGNEWEKTIRKEGQTLVRVVVLTWLHLSLLSVDSLYMKFSCNSC